MKVSSAEKQKNHSDSTFGDRLRFVIWLSAYNLGTESGKELASVIGKRPDQLSKWVKEDPRPEFGNIRLIAEAVGVNALWLDNPAATNAVEPEMWSEWYAQRLARRAAQKRKRA